MSLRLLRPLRPAFLLAAALQLAPAAWCHQSGDIPAAAARVNWRAWDEPTLAAARGAGQSVYVFVASELSELSRTTEREVFGRPETAAWLNENFFCIRVDAEAQPAVAAYAQHFITAARQLRGWPVHLWLTPELQPYDGANYLPPTEEWGRPGFLKSARAALEAWTQDPARARALAAEAIAQMSAPPPAATGPIDVEARLGKATAAWLAAVDATHGGFGTAPKNPEPELIRFLLTRGPEAQAAAIAAARAIVNGGLRDPTDGGFFRRTIDAEWKEPYRQKLVADQARIALALFDAAEAAKDDGLRRAADGALRFVLEKLRMDGDSFAAAIDTTESAAERRLGRAAPAATQLLLAALGRSADPALRAEGAKLAPRSRGAGGSGASTAADALASAYALRAAGRRAQAEGMVAEAVTRYFDPAAGQFMASPAKLPTGIAVRVPALAEPFSVDALALLAGVTGEPADGLRRGLLAQIEYDELPPGAVLLALGGEP